LARTPALTIANLRRELIGDSRAREKLVNGLIALVRADERAKTIQSLSNLRFKARDANDDRAERVEP